MQSLPLHIYSVFPRSQAPDQLLEGVQRYLKARYKPTATSYQVIEREGGSRLRHTAAKGTPRGSLFLVPSLINGPEIFDLTPDQSFVRFLSQLGYEVFLLEWGDLSKEENINLKDIIEKKFASFWDKAICSAVHKPHVLGYCLGGTIAAHFFTQDTKNALPVSLTFLATPFDFQASDQQWCQTTIIRQQIIANSALTQNMLQTYFFNLHPEYTEKKFCRFNQMRQNSAEEQLFIAVEKWLSGGCDIPQQLALDIVDYYFSQNQPLAFPDDLPSIPLCMIVSEDDKIISNLSASYLHQKRLETEFIQTSCGHIGMMAGRRAEQSVWKPFLSFLKTAATQQNQGVAKFA